jgi:hypothetical protein
MNRTDLKTVLQYLEDKNIDRARGYLTKKLEDLEAKAIKLGKIIEIELQGKEPTTVKAFPVGKFFAIHKQAERSKFWTVTHVPSGLAATGDIRRKALATLYAKAFAEIKGVSWENKEPLRGLDSVTMTALTELARAGRANKPLAPKAVAA